jgi:DDE family transposase
MDTDVIYENDWQLLIGFLPADIENLAVCTGALVRRREIRTATDLVRLALVYGDDDASLRGVSAWAKECGIGCLSDQAVLKRLRSSVGLLRELCSRMLSDYAPKRAKGDLRFVLVDSTTICRRRSTGTDFRVHVNYVANDCAFAGMELTRSDGGEGIDRLPCGQGDVLVADQGYPSRARLAEVRSRDAHFIVRFHPANLPLQDSSGLRINSLSLCQDLQIGQTLDLPISSVPTKDTPAISGRLVAVRKTDEAAARQLERSRKNSGKEPSPETQLAAKYILLFTSLSLDQADTHTILDAYRLRWQVEMAFKRAKGIVSLGETAAKDLDLCEAKILAKLLLLLLIQAYETVFFPWGYPLPRFEQLAKA